MNIPVMHKMSATITHNLYSVLAPHADILLSSLWVSQTGSASDWCALQEVLYRYNTIHTLLLVSCCLITTPCHNRDD